MLKGLKENGSSKIRGRWRRIVAAMCCLVVFSVTYALILPAITISDEAAEAEPGIVLEEMYSEDTAAEGPALSESDFEDQIYEPSWNDGVQEDGSSEDIDIAENETEDDRTEVLPDETSEESALADFAEYIPQQFLQEVSGVTIAVEADAGAFPAGTEMAVSLVPEEQVLDALKDVVTDRIVWVQAVDISFYDAEGGELQPLIPIRVSISLDQPELNIPDETEVVHVDDGGAAQIVECASYETDQELNEVVFESDVFSIYAVVGTVIEKNVLSDDGRNYRISVTYGPDAGIPSGADLDISEIVYDTDSISPDVYERYVSKAEEALGWEPGSTAYARVFDISIVDGEGNKIEIESPVDVRIELEDKEYGSEAAERTRVVHFADGAESGDVLEDQEVDGQAVCFKAEGFSAYAIVEGPEAIPFSWHKISSVAELISRGSTGVYIGHPDGYYYGNTIVDDGKRTGIVKTKPANNYPVDDAAMYYFEQAEGTDNQFYAYCYADDGVTKQYVRNNNNNSLSFAATENDKTAFTVTIDENGQFLVRNGQWYWNMQGGANGKRFCAYTSDDSNSKVVFWYYENTFDSDPYGLDGLSYGLMEWNNSVAGKALMADREEPDGLRAKALMVMSTVDNTDRLFVPNDSDISMWTFHWIEDDKYYITSVVDGSTKYLAISSSGLDLVSAVQDASIIQVVPGTGVHAGQIALKSGNTALTYTGTVDGGFSVGGSVGSEWLHLVELSELTSEYYMINSARKVSVSDPGITNGSRVIVYTRSWNEEKKQYDYYAIDSDGSLVPVYEKGDSIEWVSHQLNTLLWNFVEYYWEGTTDPNFYYELYNQYSDKYIAPQEEAGQILSDDTIGINLNGRRDGRYYSTIQAWDEDAFSYVGLKVEDGRIVVCPQAEAMDFYFAIMEDQNVDDDLIEVPTVNNAEHGITMKLVDIDTRERMSTYLGSDEGGLTLELVQGLLSTDLGEDGYPVAAGGSLGALYAGEQDINHLFILSTYEETGYFEFDSTQNFATLKGATGGDFTVYKELGTYDSPGSRYTLKHGQFFPFNDLKPGVFASVNGKNLYSLSQSEELPDSDPRKYESLYSIEHDGNKANTQFAMELEASFTQTNDGLDDWGHDIIFEFTGDDDFWFYVDGELVIDLGGIHSAVPGNVNFRTGEVNVNGTHTTLKDLFYSNYLGRGHTAEEAQAYVDGIFELNDEGNWIFKSYTNHTMNIFYMERGAGASNLHMRFNLSAVKKGTALLHKELAGVDSTESIMAEFAYQILYKKEDGTEHYLTNAIAHSAQQNEDYVYYKDSTHTVKYLESLEIGGVAYNDVFLLKPGETAEINFPEGMETYRIIECGINTDIYSTVTVNGTQLTGTSGTGYAENREDFGIGYATTDDRARVNYVNEVDPDALCTLTIDKLLFKEDGITPLSFEDDQTMFTFRLYLAAEFDDLDVANMHTYHVKDPEGNYCVWDRTRHIFVSLGPGKTDYNSLTEEEKGLVSFTTSIYGSITNVQAGYTIEIRNVLAGTQFRIVERPWEIPDGYSFQKYIYNGTESEAAAAAGIEDTVVSGTEPHVDVCNLKGWGLRINKVWTDADYMAEREAAYFAVFTEDPDTGALTLVEEPNTVRQLPYEADPQTLYWYFEHLPVSDVPFDNYVIREVEITAAEPNVSEDGTVTDYGSLVPIGDGEEIRLTGRQKGEEEGSEFTYTVLYGEAEMPEDANVHIDTVTNSRPGIILKKAEWDGVTPLAGAHFTLSDEEGREIGTFISDENGLITVAFLREDIEYTLTETDAPHLFRGLESAMTIVGHDGVVSAGGVDEVYYIVDNEAEMPTVTVKNRPLIFRAVKKDRETEEPLGGVVFALHRQVTVDGVTTIDLNPMPGYEHLVTEADGSIPMVDETLRAGTYELREIMALTGYPPLPSYLQFTISPSGAVTLGTHPEGVSLTEETEVDGTVSYEMTILNSRRKYVSFKKVDIADVEDSALEGAVFDLYSVTVTDGIDVRDLPALYTGLVSNLEGLLEDADGNTVFELPFGRYHLVETAAPPGYHMRTEPVVIDVTSSDVDYEDGTNISHDGRGKSWDPEERVYTLKISNTTGAELPYTGGPGTKAFPIAGGALTVLAAAALMVRLKRQRRKGGGPGS